jgi:hypothetical protein
MSTPVIGVLFQNLTDQEIHGLNKLLQTCNTSVVECYPSDEYKNADSTTTIYYRTETGGTPNESNPVIATLQSYYFKRSAKMHVEITNLCTSHDLNTSYFTELINSLISQSRKDLDQYTIDSHLVSVDINSHNYRRLVYALAGLNFFVNGIGDKRPSGCNSPDIVTIEMVLGDANKSIVASEQADLAVELLTEYNTKVVNCTKLVKISPNLCKELRNVLHKYDREVANFFYLHSKQKSDTHESIYNLAADLGGPNTDLVIAQPDDRCNVMSPDDLSKKVYFHTHASICHEKTTQIGWPSTKDFASAFYSFAELDHLAYIVISLGGIYILRPQRDLKQNVLEHIQPEHIQIFRHVLFLYLEENKLDLKRGFLNESDALLFNSDVREQPISDLFAGLNHPRVTEMAMFIQKLTYRTIMKFWNDRNNIPNNPNDLVDFGLITVEYKTHKEIQKEGGYEFTVYGGNQERDQCFPWNIDQIPNGKEVIF